eukprot:maker-scaffold82_size396747-snap-gene-2.32 protein:Tk06828 transcript:maker-scaffold82_size396747-snap-gene-2.32-mRNA-1 annotation:"---NA---"
MSSSSHSKYRSSLCPSVTPGWEDGTSCSVVDASNSNSATSSPPPPSSDSQTQLHSSSPSSTSVHPACSSDNSSRWTINRKSCCTQVGYAITPSSATNEVVVMARRSDNNQFPLIPLMLTLTYYYSYYYYSYADLFSRMIMAMLATHDVAKSRSSSEKPRYSVEDRMSLDKVASSSTPPAPTWVKKATQVEMNNNNSSTDNITMIPTASQGSPSLFPEVHRFADPTGVYSNEDQANPLLGGGSRMKDILNQLTSDKLEKISTRDILSLLQCNVECARFHDAATEPQNHTQEKLITRSWMEQSLSPSPSSLVMAF